MTAVPIPEPELTPAELLARAVALRPLVREQQDESEDRGHYGEVLHEEFRRAGFYRILQPRRFGGYEFDLPTFFKVMLEIARGDPGTGWCLCLGSGHALPVAAHWPEHAQAEIFGTDGHFVAPHSARGVGVARPVDGGYLVSGTWDYCSGIPHSTHFIGTTFVNAADPGVEPAAVAFVVPRGQYAILDDWGGDAVLGMRASGSNSARIDDVFVPSHLVVPFDWMSFDPAGGTPGTRLHGNPMYLGRLLGFYNSEITVPVVGAARAALDEYEQIITTRRTTTAPHMLRYQRHDFQQVFGTALRLVDSAEVLLIRSAELAMEQCRRSVEGGSPYTLKEDMRLAGLVHQAGALAAEAVQILFHSAGSGATKQGQRLQRYFRDVSTQRTTFAVQPITTATWAALSYFDLPGNPFASL